MSHTPFSDSFLDNSHKLAQRITQRRFDLIALLRKYETQSTAEDEIERSLDTLMGFKGEFAPIKQPLKDLTISTFFPLNLPLYSLVLFGIAPSAFAKHVFIRPPEVMHSILEEVFEFLEIKNFFPNISVHAVPRYVFMELYASESDVIVFTGKYENAITIHKQCPQALLVYNGSGINPFLIFGDADVDLAVEKAVEMRCFNSGQDCAGPDAFFVPSSLADSFVGKLQDKLERIKVGDSQDPEVKVSRIIKDTYIAQLKSVIDEEREHLVFGGQIDEEKHYVHPAIIRKPVSDHDGDIFHEFFAPVFYVLEYADDKELEEVLHTKKFKERTMYISVFGENNKVEKKLPFATLLKNKIVNDVERGNNPYGGYGQNANFLFYGQGKDVHPVLISRDMHGVLA